MTTRIILILTLVLLAATVSSFCLTLIKPGKFELIPFSDKTFVQ